MQHKSWWKNSGRCHQKRVPRREAAHRIAQSTAARFRRLILEPLEERSLLAVITVTRMDDAVGTGDGVTLREAIVAANTNAAVDGSAAGQAAPTVDTIVFAAGLSGTISLGAGGQLSISETVIVQGNGAASTIIDAHGASRAFEILASGGDVTFDGVTITGGVHSSRGAGVNFDSTGLLTVQNSTIFGNSISTQVTPSGGGIFSSGAVTVTGSTIRDNSVFTSSDFSSAQGGGIFAFGVVTVISSTISGNLASVNDPTSGAFGGGIQSISAVRITQSTISGNSAAALLGDSSGGGIEAPEILLTHSTVTGNSASGANAQGGGLSSGAITIRNSIVAGNTDTTGVAPDFLKFFSDPSVVQASLIGDNNGTGLTASATPDANGNLIGTHAAPIDPNLGPLTNNGGPTKTHATLANSPALNRGKIAHAQALLATPGLRALYKLNDPGFTAVNSSGVPGLDGTYIGGFPITNSLATGDGGNTLGDANSFNGTSDQVTLPSALVPAGGFTDFSLSFWLKTTQTSAPGSNWWQGRGLVDGEVAGVSADFGTSQLNGKFAFGVGGADTTVQSSQTINDGQWHHVVATRVSDSGAMAVYVDGVLGGTASGPTGARTATTRLVMASLQTNVNFFAGQLDEAAIFTRALSAGEVASLYQAEVPADFDQRGVPFRRVSDLRDMGAYERQNLPGLVFQVSTAIDENDGNISGGDLSLREAIGLANGNAGSDTITFAPELNGQPILLTQGQLEIAESVTIQGNGAANTIIDAQQQSRVFDILTSGGAVTFEGVTVRNGKVTAALADGGGIRSLSGETLTIQNSVLTGNTTTASGTLGGAIMSLGPVAVSGSTIRDNSANFGGGVGTSGEAVTVTNSTISGNRATVGGGGMYADSVTVTNSTITDNEAGLDGGGIFSVSGSLILRNSIVAGNRDTGDGSNPDFRGLGIPSVSAQASLIGDHSGTNLAAAPPGSPDANGNLIGTPAAPIDPKLAPLADNGGPTQTHALLPGSPAIDAGNNALLPAGTTTDQRGSGFPRLINARRDQAPAQVDMGAMEYNSLLVTTKDDENDATYNAADLSLREALAISNSTPIDSIFFADTMSGQTITLSLGELTVSKAVSIQGLGADKLSISGGGGATQSRVLHYAGSGSNAYSLAGLTIRDGNGKGADEGFGGAIYFNDDDDRLTIADSVIRDNTAISGGLFGGGIGAALGALQMTNITVTNNTAGYGGGIGLQNVRAVLTNVTISSNKSQSDGASGIDHSGSGNGQISTLVLVNSTIASNQSAGRSGIENFSQNGATAAVVTIANSIVANNIGGGTQILNATSGGAGATIVSLGHNITSDASGNLTGPGDLQNTNPRLAPLAIYDGVLPTHAFCIGVDTPAVGCTGLSPALNAGNNALAVTVGPDGAINTADDVPLVTDARGMPFERVVAGTVDIGAFEYFINHEPTCDVGTLPPIDDEQGLVVIPNFVSNCTANDPLQTVMFAVSSTIPQLFTTPPRIDAAGTLSFDPAPNVHGDFALKISFHDDGGTFGGGSNQSLFNLFPFVEKKHRYFNAAETGARRGLDVTGSTSPHPDGFIVAQDVLTVINHINAKGSGPIPTDNTFGPPYVDTDGDDQVVANDALKIINWINANPGQSEAEGEDSSLPSGQEAVAINPTTVGNTSTEAWLLLLATDVASQPRRGRRG